MIGSAKGIAAKSTIVPLLRTATVTGAAVDVGGVQRAAIVVNVGAITDGTHTLSIEESVDSAFTSPIVVAAADREGTPGVLVANTPVVIGYLGSKRYVRAKVTVTGSPSTGGNYSAMVLRMGPARKSPVT